MAGSVVAAPVCGRHPLISQILKIRRQIDRAACPQQPFQGTESVAQRERDIGAQGGRNDTGMAAATRKTWRRTWSSSLVARSQTATRGARRRSAIVAASSSQSPVGGPVPRGSRRNAAPCSPKPTGIAGLSKTSAASNHGAPVPQPMIGPSSDDGPSPQPAQWRGTRSTTRARHRGRPARDSPPEPRGAGC